MISSSYGVPLQNGQTHTTSSLANTHPLALAELGLERGAQDAAAFEAAEGALLFEHLARHERQAEQLAVRVGDRCAGLAAVVDDRLRVADVGCRRVLEEAALQHQHHLGGVGVADVVDAGVVVAGEHEDLVDAAGLGLDVHRPAVVHGERLVAVERRVQVGDHPHAPRAIVVDGLERRQGDLLVARAERARSAGVGFDLGDAGAKSVGRSARSATIVTHRPVSGLRRS